MADPSSQRAYRAACPGCGAPVSFRSAQSTHAVCGYCQSTVVRNGDVLSRVGKMAELFDDHSLLQLGASGQIPAASGTGSIGFTLIGRLQYRSSSGTWTEWLALEDDGKTASLSEDNGAYVYARPRKMKRDMPDPSKFRLGLSTAIDGQQYSVASNDQVTLISAQGELPRLPPLGEPFAMVELRSQGDATQGNVITLDYGPTLSGKAIMVSIGTPVQLEDLHITGLKDESTKDEKGRHFDCPSCGAPVSVELESTKRLTCSSCHSLIDLTQGIGAEVVAAKQTEPVQALIPLGTTGQLQGKAWQVVGFQHRMGEEPDDPDEQFGWSEYLLYNAKAGFQFLVDAEDGWSLVKPATGAPTVSANLQEASYLGKKYNLLYSYKAETMYVEGEFYWPVERGQKTFNRDYGTGNALLSQEESAKEITWSSGVKLKAETVALAFGLKDKLDLLQRDAAPTSGMSIKTKIIILLIVLFVLWMVYLAVKQDDCNPNVEKCSTSSGSSTRISSGSWGGYSSGGSHK